MFNEVKALRVLIIDDEPQILESCKSILAPSVDTDQVALDSLANSIFDLPEEVAKVSPPNSFTFEICTAHQGLEGVEKADQAFKEGRPYAIAFIDMRMPPGIDGLETANRIIQASPGIEIVIVTAYSDTPLVEMTRQLGESRFLLLKKPFDPDELIQMGQFLAYRWQIGQLSRAYERFVPKEFIKLLNKTSILDVGIGDHIEADISVLFADIRSFTTLSERLTPNEIFRFLNSYLGIMGPVIRRNGGMIDKFIGDAIMALFNQGPDDALVGAMEMLRALKVYNEGRVRAGYVQIKIGIGINTGRVMLGTLGENERMEGSVVSDAVNVAARIERLTKEYGVGLLISEHSYQQLRDPSVYHMRLVDQAHVAGRDGLVSVYEVYDTDPEYVRDAKDQNRQVFEDAVRLFHSKQVDAAHKLFDQITGTNYADPVVALYLKRCRYFEEFGIYDISD